MAAGRVSELHHELTYLNGKRRSGLRELISPWMEDAGAQDHAIEGLPFLKRIVAFHFATYVMARGIMLQCCLIS